MYRALLFKACVVAISRDTDDRCEAVNEVIAAEWRDKERSMLQDGFSVEIWHLTDAGWCFLRNWDGHFPA